MTRQEGEQVEKHFDELYAIATGITPNIPEEIRQAMKEAYVAGADYAVDMFVPRWISVEDALPEKVGFYNVVLNGDAHSLWYYPSINEWAEIYADGAGYLQNRKIEGVTHWQRLPAPPEKGD